MNIEVWVRKLFDVSTESIARPGSLEFRNQEKSRGKCFMTFDTREDKLEIPLFALYPFIKTRTSSSSPDIMVTILKSRGYVPYYSSFSKVMQTVFNTSFVKSRLIRIEGKGGDNTNVYYATKAALFDEHLKPLVVCSWEMQKVFTHSTNYEYQFVRPIVRITPEFYLSKPDNVIRYIMKKLLPTALSMEVCIPYVSNYYFSAKTVHRSASVLIEPMPYKIDWVEKPSIHTTSEDLCKVVLDNMYNVL